MSSDSKSKSKDQSLEQAKEEAGDAMNQTIITGRKIVIDPVTGQVSIEEPEPEVAAGDETAEVSLEAAGQSAEEDAVAEEKPADSELTDSESSTSEEVVDSEDGDSEDGDSEDGDSEDGDSTAANSIEDIPEPIMQTMPESIPDSFEGDAAVDVGDMTMANANKRLSAETLFAFALPEPVLNKAMADAKKNADAQEKSEKVQAFGLGKKIGLGILSAVVVVGGLVFAFLGDGKKVEVAKKEASVPKVVADTEPAEEKKVAPAKEKAFEGRITKENVKELSNEQLAQALGSQDVGTITVTIVEASKRKDPKLIEKVVALGMNDDYIIRVTAVKAFADRASYPEENSDAVLAMLLERLDDPDEIVRGFAAKAIGASGDATALTKLRGRLDLEESDVVNKMIRAAIVKLGRE